MARPLGPSPRPGLAHLSRDMGVADVNAGVDAVKPIREAVSESSAHRKAFNDNWWQSALAPPNKLSLKNVWEVHVEGLVLATVGARSEPPLMAKVRFELLPGLNAECSRCVGQFPIHSCSMATLTNSTTRSASAVV